MPSLSRPDTLDTNSGKTAHGLIRGTDRFSIVGVIDPKHAGKDAGEVLDGKKRNIPVYESVDDFVQHGKEKQPGASSELPQKEA